MSRQGREGREECLRIGDGWIIIPGMQVYRFHNIPKGFRSRLKIKEQKSKLWKPPEAEAEFVSSTEAWAAIAATNREM
jgi:hypothetical protein